MVEIMIVVAIIGLLAAIAMPNFIQARITSQTDACINNLHQINAAKQQFALEAGKTTTYTPVSTDIQPYLGRGDLGSLTGVFCPLVTPSPMGGYTINAVGTPPVCMQYDAINHPATLE